MITLHNNQKNEIVTTLTIDNDNISQSAYTFMYLNPATNIENEVLLTDLAVPLSATTRYNLFEVYVSGTTGATGDTYIIIEDFGDYEYTFLDDNDNILEFGKMVILNDEEYIPTTTYKDDVDIQYIYKK